MAYKDPIGADMSMKDSFGATKQPPKKNLGYEALTKPSTLPPKRPEATMAEAPEAPKNDETQMAALEQPTVGYMEIPKGDFRCGTCEYAGKDEFCKNPQVNAYVSALRGCCNLFEPADGKQIDSSEWAAPKAVVLKDSESETETEEE